MVLKDILYYQRSTWGGEEGKGIYDTGKATCCAYYCEELDAAAIAREKSRLRGCEVEVPSVVYNIPAK